MPGRPSTISVMESPTGCTKQLMRVAVRLVPAAELMRPAGMKPFSCASRNFASQKARRSSLSLPARALATRARTSRIDVSPSFAYFSTRTSVLISWAGSLVMSAAGRRDLATLMR